MLLLCYYMLETGSLILVKRWPYADGLTTPEVAPTLYFSFIDPYAAPYNPPASFYISTLAIEERLVRHIEIVWLAGNCAALETLSRLEVGCYYDSIKKSSWFIFYFLKVTLL